MDGELDVPQPNSIAMQMSYPLVNVPPPPVQVRIGCGLEIAIDERWRDCSYNFVNMYRDDSDLKAEKTILRGHIIIDYKRV